MRTSLIQFVSAFIALYLSFSQIGHVFAMQELTHHGRSSLCDTQQSCVVHVHQEEEKSVFQPLNFILKQEPLPPVQVLSSKNTILLASHFPQNLVVTKNRLLTVQQRK